MSDITPFIFPTTGQTVRTVTVDGEPWFVAYDVTAILGYTNGPDAVARHVSPGQMGSVAIRDGIPGNPNRTILSEAGVWRLVMRSNRPEAIAFQDWLAEEVIPSIRKTGSYSLPREYSRLELIDLARESELARIEAEDRALAAEHELLEIAPAARAWDTLASADGDYSVREAGYILNRDPAIKTGERRLFDLLRTWRLVDWRDIPYANHAEHVRLRPRSFTNRATGEEMPAKPQVRVTAAGIRYLHKRLGGTANVADLLAEPVPA